MIAGLPYEVVNQVPMTCWDGVGGSKLFLINTMDEWRAFHSLMMKQPVVACDTETSGFYYSSGDRIVGVSFGWGHQHFYIPFRHEHNTLNGQQPVQLNFEDVKENIQAFFNREDVVVLGHNFKFDRRFYRADGIEVRCKIVDTMILWHLYDEDAPKGLKVIASGWKDDNGDWHNGIVGEDANADEKAIKDFLRKESSNRKKTFTQLIRDEAKARRKDIAYQGLNLKQIKEDLMNSDEFKDHPYRGCKVEDLHYGHVPADMMAKYAALDTFLTYQVYRYLMINFVPTASKEMLAVFDNEMELNNILFESEWAGAPMDRAYLERMSVELNTELEVLDAKIKEQLGDINIKSGPQLGAALIALGVPLEETTPTGVPKTDAKILAKFADQFDIIKTILEFKKTEKIRGTYIEGILAQLSKGDRVHYTFNQNVSTGRMSSSNPNCFSGDTEVLTLGGWVRFDALTENEHVAQYNLDGSLEFVKPIAYFRGKEELLHIKTRVIDLKVTPNHRCLLQTRSGKFVVYPAADYPEDKKQIHAGLLEGGDLSFCEARIALACAIQADAHLNISNKYDLSFSKPRKIARMQWVLDTLGVPYSKATTTKNRVRFYVPRSAITDCLGGKNFCLETLLRLDLESKKLFCKEIWNWDGSFTRKNNYSSNNKDNVIAVQTMLACTGIKSRIRSYKAASGTTNWQLDSTNKDYSWTTNRTITSLGVHDVYCVEVPSSYLLVKSGPSLLVTGNCQNVPKRDKRVKTAFLCEKDHVFVFFDYSQVELRLLAHVSQDPVLLDAFHKDQDIHTRTACEMFKLDYDVMDPIIKAGPSHPEYDFYDEYRGVAKTTNFAIIYGQSGMGMAEGTKRPKEYADLSWDAWVQTCDNFIKSYLDRLPKVRKFIYSAQKEAVANGVLYNAYGRARRLPNAQIKDRKQFWKVNRAKRQGVNFLVQGLAADVFKSALVKTHHNVLKGKKSRIVNCVHDEVQLFIHKDELDLIGKVKQSLEDFDFLVPLKVDFAYSMTNWAEKQSK